MRVKALFISAIIGTAVITGIFKGLTAPRIREKKEEKEGEKEEHKNHGCKGTDGS